MPDNVATCDRYVRFALASASPTDTGPVPYRSSCAKFDRISSVYLRKSVSPYWYPVPPMSVAPLPLKSCGQSSGWVRLGTIWSSTML